MDGNVDRSPSDGFEDLMLGALLNFLAENEMPDHQDLGADLWYARFSVARIIRGW